MLRRDAGDAVDLRLQQAHGALQGERHHPQGQQQNVKAMNTISLTSSGRCTLNSGPTLRVTVMLIIFLQFFASALSDGFLATESWRVLFKVFVVFAHNVFLKKKIFIFVGFFFFLFDQTSFHIMWAMIEKQHNIEMSNY